MSGPYVAAFLIKGGYGELTPHPALRGHLQSTRQEPPTAVALRHAPAGAAPQGKAHGGKASPSGEAVSGPVR